MDRYTDEGKYAIKDMSEIGIIKAEKRLKMYEDTGLLPDEVERMKRDAEKYKGVGLLYEKEIAELHANLEKKKEECNRADKEREMWKSLFEESKQEKAERRKKNIPWLEAALYGSSSVLMGLSWLDLNLWPLLPIYWTLLAVYWGAAIWRRWNEC